MFVAVGLAMGYLGGEISGGPLGEVFKVS
jgi:hypothetical protein